MESNWVSASKTATPPEPECSLKEELEEEEHWQVTASLREDVHWVEQSTDGEESEESEMTEGEDNVELCGNSGLYYAMTSNFNVVPLIDKQRMHLSE